MEYCVWERRAKKYLDLDVTERTLQNEELCIFNSAADVIVGLGLSNSADDGVGGVANEENAKYLNIGWRTWKDEVVLKNQTYK